MAGNNSFMTSLLALLDDDKFMTDVACSGTELVNVQYLLSIVEKILNQATALAGNTQPKGDQGQSKSSTFPLIGTSNPLSSTINKLCSQITCEALHADDVYQTMASLFDKLSPFSWNAKAVLTLSAFAVYYAKNCRLAQIEGSDDLLSLTAWLGGFGATGNSSNTHRNDAFVELNGLIKETLVFTKYVVEHVNSYSASADELACFKYIIVVVLGCSVQFSGLISASNEFVGPDLSTFSNRVMMRYASFKKQFLYEEIKRRSKYCADIVELMEVLVCTEDGSREVYQCSKSTTVKVEELKNKSVLLLISDLNLSNDDLGTLTSIYHDRTFQSSNYEIMWVPIGDLHNEAMRKQFLNKRSQMKWYTCNSTVSKSAATFIQRKWQFRQETKVVVLNQQGKVVNMDAMMMIRLFGWEAFPFTESKCKELWSRQRINWLELVFPAVEQSIQGKELIFLYGSAEDSKIVESVEKCLSEIKNYCLSDKLISINTRSSEQFLTRLESCMSLKMQASSDVYDSQMEELFKLYTIYKQQGGFGILARGSNVVVNTRLTDFETVLSQHQKWMSRITKTQAFECVFKTYYEEVVAKTNCHRVYIPNMAGNAPVKLMSRV